MKKTLAYMSLVLVLMASCTGKNYKKDSLGVTVSVTEAPAGGPSVVRLQVLGDKIIRVTASPESRIVPRKSLITVPQEGRTSFKVSSGDGFVEVSTASLSARVDTRSGKVKFIATDGTVLEEHSKSFEPVEVEGKKGWSTFLSFESPDDEAFYGLGQQQSLEFNHKGGNEELFQYNTKVSIPFIASSRGYGLLWDSYSFGRFGNPSPYLQLGKAFKLYDKDGREGSLTGTYTPASGRSLVRQEDSLYFENEFTLKNLPDINLEGASVVFEGFIEAPEDGEYHFIQYYAGFQRTLIGGREVMSERWRPAWNPNSYKYTVRLAAGEKTPVRIEWKPDGATSYIGLRVAPLRTEEEQGRLSIWTEFDPSIDYYYIGGDDYDEIIKGYRTLTGKAQIMPRWALGFWQSRERYTTQDEIVGTLAEFRRRGIPVDNIVQDWQYWADDQWGSHEFEPSRYPDPEKMLDDIHGMHGRFMISVWPKFYTNTDHYKELKAAGYAYTHAEEDSLRDWLGHLQSFYDAYSEGGRKMFWRQMDETLYSRYGKKIDAWWMDASEPNLRDCLPMDYLKWLTTPTGLGPSTEYLNAYSIVNADAIYNGQRSVDPDKRVFLLTRSGFAGEQRYSTATWSGDIGTSWLDMRAQMSAGLGFSMSGVPFWGMDIGGFSVMSKFYTDAARDEWRELQTRWHQFGAFVPLFRTHGQWPPRELWNIAPEGSPAYESILYYMRLRYNLMPYLYSLAAAVHFDDYTIMRGLPMDFPDDKAVADLSDQWMFGPAFMPCPVYEYKARSREVYLPDGGWYDFYTGRYLEGGRKLSAEAPYDRMPLYVRAGSIVPYGPDMQWSDEKPADVIRLYVYKGADAKFTLYEDENLNYNYEKGAWMKIPLDWNEASGILTIGDREGSFPGMLENRIFVVVPVSPDAPASFSAGAPGTVIEYNGSAIAVRL